MKLGLNVGSGQRRFTSTPEVEWVNIDKVSRIGHEPDLLCDGASVPYKDGTVDYFVLHHVLEHFGCGEAADLIKEANRVLRPGGSLLVFVPNMKALATAWLGASSKKITEQIYMTNVYGAYMGNEEDRHRWGYTEESLHDFLHSVADWTSTIAWREQFQLPHIPGADIAQDWWILSMEARK